ncbi:MAG: primosomal protein N', partial [Elusimicrobiota bacterium]
KDLSLNPNNEVQDDMWEFYKWLSDYYICPLSDVLKNAIPRPVFFKKPVLEKWVSINPEITDRIESEKIKSAKCWECIEFLKQKKEVPYNEILNSGIGASTIKTLKKRQIVHIDLRPKQRTSTRQCETSPQIKSPPVLSPEQESVFKKIWGDFKNGDFARAFLIHGVTGSGKTFVYISLARMMLEHGYSVLVLVPEISLTPQIINRFKQFFGECIAVWHSRLSLMEKYESWNALTEGRKKIVIGVRSSVFAPLRNLGLIIVDEEHDGSYKQSESSFRYNARDAAVMRAKMSGALVVLGSATPSLESYQNAIDGKYVLLNMAQRYNQAPLPPVHLVDMAAERNVNNWGVFSNKLKDMITRRLEKKEQVILLLNRRGFSHFLICNRCGFVKKCVNCDITLTYHREENNLLCHYCGYTENVFSICPQCHHPTLKPSGVGIQKVERDLRAVFENARILRLDFDSVKRVGDVQTILEKFEKREADILIGTQMVCKGLDFPGVTLVGVILAETSLFFPDFKANERTFQMLNQVAGRAGRGEQAGEVVFQTYC